MIKGILVATDASPAANNAVDFGADLSAKYAAPLSLLYVARDMQLPPELHELVEVEKIRGARKEVFQIVGKRILDEAQSRALAKGATNVHTAILEGDPATRIIDHAKSRGANLIVMGTRGLGQVKSMLLGSVSRKVVNSTDIHCLIVRD